MRGITFAALACALGSGVGCLGSAKYVSQTPNGGVIELKAGADPKEVEKLIVQHVGKDFTVAPMPGTQGQVAQTPFDPNAPVKPAQPPAAGTAPTYYQYAKKMPTGVTPTGLPAAPTDGGVMQTGFQQRQPQGGMMPPQAGAMNTTPQTGMMPQQPGTMNSNANRPPAMFPGQ